MSNILQMTCNNSNLIFGLYNYIGTNFYRTAYLFTENTYFCKNLKATLNSPRLSSTDKFSKKLKKNANWLTENLHLTELKMVSSDFYVKSSLSNMTF